MHQVIFSVRRISRRFDVPTVSLIKPHGALIFDQTLQGTRAGETFLNVC